MNRDEIVALLLSRYESPLHQGRPETFDAFGVAGNPGCGDIVRLFLTMDGDRITAAAFEGRGCIISQGATDLLLDFLEGKTLEEVERLGVDFLVDFVGTELLQTRVRCAAVGLQAAKRAAHKIRSNREREKHGLETVHDSLDEGIWQLAEGD